MWHHLLRAKWASPLRHGLSKVPTFRGHMVRPWLGLVVTKKRYRKCDRSWECRWAIYQGLNCPVVPTMSYHRLVLGSNVLLAELDRPNAHRLASLLGWLAGWLAGARMALRSTGVLALVNRTTSTRSSTKDSRRNIKLEESRRLRLYDDRFGYIATVTATTTTATATATATPTVMATTTTVPVVSSAGQLLPSREQNLPSTRDE
uniref:Uncharacterized protein n=1 Tax=Vespula pensylvanica TaxID=30213 RepID=A0A834JFX2_VESPE|nr:hypothetical protein H0235_018270 [Vespula pensylvanica]